MTYYRSKQFGAINNVILFQYTVTDSAITLDVMRIL